MQQRKFQPRRLGRRVPVLGLLAACLLFGGGWFWQKKAKPAPRRSVAPGKLTPAQRKEVVKIFSSFIRDIDFTGLVYGSDGGPIEHARVFAIIADGKRGREYTEDKYTDVNGRFHFRYKNNVGFTFQISAPGYYRETNLRLNDYVTGRTKSGHAFIGAKDVRYVLEKVGPAKPMIKRELLSLEFHVRKPWIVRQLAEMKDGKPVLCREALYHKVDMTGKTVADLPPFYFYIRAATKDGRIVTVEKEVRIKEFGTSAHYRPRSLPEELYLGITGKGNGLQIWTPPPGTPKKRWPYLSRYMKEAPKDGYTPEILIDQTRTFCVYFTFKLGPWYGKGWIQTGRSISKESKFEPGSDDHVECNTVVILIQPDGTRNIRHPAMLDESL